MLRPKCFGTARALLAALALTLAATTGARAGGSAETTLLVVNADSPLSLAVANEYIRLRALPERQVLWLKNIPPVDTIDIDTFRKRILEPIRAHLAMSGLEEEIDLIAYSAGFPYAVNFRGDEAAAGLAKDRYRGDAGSLTGMTFFAREVLAGGVGYFNRRANHYFRAPQTPPGRTGSAPKLPGGGKPRAIASQVTLPATRGFRAQYRWASVPGQRQVADGRYYLSVMLGYTGLRGNSLPEIADYLGTATASDGTRPDGTVYLMENRNIRGRVRSHFFPPTVDALAERGHHAEILTQGRNGQNGREPRHKTDIIGLVAGTRGFRWEGSGSRFLPGAIAESFTSYGGHFAVSSQTKLTEFLRRGAAGSSGAVREPYAFLEKFPLPQLHVHYADGSSLAEAFYQSVASPYQLLVVGDPLARPFARFAEVAHASPPTDAPWQGVVEVVPRIVPADERPVDRVELWIDGLRLATTTPGRPIPVDTTRLADGSHDLRLVAVEAGALETRSVFRREIRVDNHGRLVELTEVPAAVPYGRPLALAGRAPDARRVILRQGGRLLAQAVPIDGRWRATVDSAVLGQGSVSIRAEAEYAEGGNARSAPVEIRVTTPPLVAADAASAASQPGPVPEQTPRQSQPGGRTVDGLSGPLPGKPGRDESHPVRVSGAFEAHAEGLYEIVIEGAGELILRIGADWQHRAVIAHDAGGIRLAVPLAAGWHRFELTLDAPGTRWMDVLLAGPEPAFQLTGDRVRRP